MNRLRTEIRACMSGLQDGGEGRYTATFRFGDDFIGFKGHFADRAVLPGVCKIQAALVMSEMLGTAPVRLHEVVMAKFFSPVESGDELCFECRETESDDGLNRLKILVTREGERVARMELLISHPQQ